MGKRKLYLSMQFIIYYIEFANIIKKMYILDNVCIDSMSVKINRKLMERSSANIQLLEKTIAE